MTESKSLYAGKAKCTPYRFLIHALVIIFKIIPSLISLSLSSFSDIFYGNFGFLIRYCILEMAQQFGERIYIGRGVEIRNWGNLEIGDHVSIYNNCYFEAEGGVTIGSEVSIAPHTSILSADHGWSRSIRDNKVPLRPIVSCGCRILSGVIRLTSQKNMWNLRAMVWA